MTQFSATAIQEASLTHGDFIILIHILCIQMDKLQK